LLCNCEELPQTGFFAHFGGPGTIPSRPLKHKFGLELMMSPKKLSRKFCGPRSSCCASTVKNCLKQAFFAHFVEPGTISSRPIKDKYGLELMMSPKKLSRRLCVPWSSGCIATAKNRLKQAFFAHFGRPGTIPSRPIMPQNWPRSDNWSLEGSLKILCL